MDVRTEYALKNKILKTYFLATQNLIIIKYEQVKINMKKTIPDEDSQRHFHTLLVT